MATVCGITSVKQMTYRDDSTEQFSNKYHFRDAPPTTAAAWHTLALALFNVEKTIFDASIKMVAAYGYNTDNPADASVWSYDFLTAGEAVTGAFVPDAAEHKTAGDQASKIGWQLDKKNSKGKWIYLAKYMHGAYVSNTDVDVLGATYQTAADAFASALDPGAGAFNGGIRAQKYDVPVLYAWADKWITTRTLKRRGKRPLAHA